MGVIDLGSPRAADRPALRATLGALRSAGKPRRGVSAWSIYVNRPAGRYVAAVAFRLGLSPNRLSVLSGLLSFAGIVALAFGPLTAATGFSAAAALGLGFVLDSADGQLARFTGRCTAAGEWLDHLVDCATKLGVHGAVVLAWMRLDETGGLLGGSSTLLMPMMFQCVAVLMFFGGTLMLKLRPPAAVHSATESNAGRNGILRPLALLPVDHGILCLVFVLWAWHQIFLVLYAAMFIAHLVYLCLFTVLWFRRLEDG